MRDSALVLKSCALYLLYLTVQKTARFCYARAARTVAVDTCKMRHRRNSRSVLWLADRNLDNVLTAVFRVGRNAQIA
jgi:hypothetical protein